MLNGNFGLVPTCPGSFQVWPGVGLGRRWPGLLKVPGSQPQHQNMEEKSPGIRPTVDDSVLSLLAVLFLQFFFNLFYLLTFLLFSAREKKLTCGKTQHAI